MLTVTLRRREAVASGTVACYFERPPDFVFKGGQFVEITLIDPPQTDEAGNTRTLSIASGPQDPDLVVATRLRDTAFKRSLASLPVGAGVRLEGPFGSFTLHRNAAKPAVFLAGGIGITPFIGMLRQLVADDARHEVYLFYANHRPKDAAFLDQLQAMAVANPAIHFIPTMTTMTGSDEAWDGETGFVDRAMLAAHLPSVQGPIYYIAGPPAMVTASRSMLLAASVDEDDIRTEEFGGY
jgi:ferredoxin-NADP reductase